LTAASLGASTLVLNADMASNLDNQHRTRLIDVLIFNGINILDLAGPVQAFDNVEKSNACHYRIRYVSIDGNPVRTSCGLILSAETKLSRKSRADDLLIPGGNGVDAYLSDLRLRGVICAWMKRAGDNRLMSVCSGALLLAAAGVLDGEPATCHWSRSKMAMHLFPEVRWDFDKIYTTSHRIYTSAGVTTGIDLALAIITKDCGAGAALRVAQELVVFMKRSGGQGQFSQSLKGQFELGGKISELVEAITCRPQKKWSLEVMADAVSMSGRTLSRKFLKSIGITPIQFVERTRIDLARNLIAADLSLKTVAVKSGFGDLQRMRRSFKKQLGVNILEYAARFGSNE
jgi:transcriptional regulator GlxA family with amidase domain